MEKARLVWWSVGEYIKYGQENIDGKWAKELENASTRVHISRLEALQTQLQQHVESLYGNQLDGLDKLIRGIYTKGYDRTMFEVQKGLNLGWSFQRFNEDQLDDIINKPWTVDEKTFRDRCWTDKAKLLNTLQTHLFQALVRGDSLDKVIDTIAKELNVPKRKASTLVQTEASFAANKAQQRCYNDLDVERVQITETLDSRTCDTCGPMDGIVIKLKDAKPGITAPPFHPNCRGCTAPFFEDDVGERIARDLDGKTYYVPDNMTYREWEKAFVDGDKSFYSDNYIFKKNKVKKGYGIISEESKKIINEAEKNVLNDFLQLEKIIDPYAIVHEGEVNPASAKLVVTNDGSVKLGIEYNGDMWDNVDKVKNLVKAQSKIGGHIKTDNPQSIIYHEYGHTVHNALSLLKAGYIKGQKLTPTQMKEVNFYHKQLSQQVYLAAFTDESLDEIKDIISKKISSRAKYNGNEFIAECFSQYYSGVPTKISQKIVQLFIDEFRR